MNFTKSVVDTLNFEMKRINNIDNKKGDIDLNFKNSLELNNITFKYLNTKFPALENISMKIIKNTSTVIIGESGAGKSTLIDVILGLINPDDGKILIDNVAHDLNNINWHKKMKA